MERIERYYELNSLYKRLVDELKDLQYKEDKKKREIYVITKQIEELSNERLD
jgi:hypothetical protein